MEVSTTNGVSSCMLERGYEILMMSGAKYGPLPDLSFSGISTFAHLEHHKCLDTQKPFDVGILGVPFDVSQLGKRELQANCHRLLSLSVLERDSDPLLSALDPVVMPQAEVTPFPGVSTLSFRATTSLVRRYRLTSADNISGGLRRCSSVTL